MQNVSLEDIDISNLKNFLIKLCVVSSRHAERGFAISHFQAQFENLTENSLRDKIKQLEEDLQKAKEERDRALKENRNRIDELNIALMSIKTRIDEVIKAKKEREARTSYLEAKIKRTS